MMGLIGRVLSRTARTWQAAGVNSTVSSECTDVDIEHYYYKLIRDSLERMLVAASDTEITVKRSGISPSGLASFCAHVRILRWHPITTPVLMQNIPVVDARIQRLVSASVILQQTHFAGLWFQASSNMEGSPKALLGLPFQLSHRPSRRTSSH